MIALACVRYLCDESLILGKHSTSLQLKDLRSDAACRARVEYNTKYTFLQYALSDWHIHATTLFILDDTLFSALENHFALDLHKWQAWSNINTSLKIATDQCNPRHTPDYTDFPSFINHLLHKSFQQTKRTVPAANSSYTPVSATTPPPAPFSSEHTAPQSPTIAKATSPSNTPQKPTTTKSSGYS